MTVHVYVVMDQNIEIEIFAEYKNTLKLPFTLSDVLVSFPYVTPLIRIGHPQTYISMESLWDYLNDGEKFYKRMAAS